MPALGVRALEPVYAGGNGGADGGAVFDASDAYVFEKR